MRSFEKITDKQILALERCEQLFSRPAASRKNEFNALALLWHPDSCKQATAAEVFQRILAFRKEAEQKDSDNSWKEPVDRVEDIKSGTTRFHGKDGKTYSVHHLLKEPFELGTLYVGNIHVTYEIQSKYEGLLRVAVKAIEGFKFKDDRMKEGMQPFLPQIEKVVAGSSSSFLVLKKSKQQFMLRDVIKHMGGEVKPAGHIGWILNVTYNMMCYLSWAKLTHNSLSLNSFFINPFDHTGVLFGGWWYSMAIGEKMNFLPDRTVETMPPDVFRNQLADQRTDLELVRALGREMLGDLSGARLHIDKKFPDALIQYLRLPSAGNAVADYQHFKKEVLPASFGPPKFVKMELDAKDLYP